MRRLLLLTSVISFLVTPGLKQYSVSAQETSAGKGQDTIVSTNTGDSPFDGISINQLVGADRFYQNGYTGSRAIAAVVEGGHIWNGHDTLGHVNQFFDARATYIDRGVDPGQLGEVDRHATWVSHTLGGRTSSNREHQKGIAHGVQLWSGAIATEWNGDPFTGSWGWSRGYAFTDAYTGVALTGSNGRTADVVNSSWGFTSSTNQSTRGGNNLFTVTYDGIAQESRAVFVSSAGNRGADPPRGMSAPGNGYNGITVGALGNDLDTPPYRDLASFSSRGVQDYNGPDGFVADARAVVDIVAPGENLTLAFYGGTTGGNRGGNDPSNGATNWYTFNTAGTSFAAPIVSGGASLLVDVAYDRFADNISNAKDGQVIKAVLLNSAAKPDDWDNGQVLSNGLVTTSQALDYSYGAGKLDLNQAFDQYTTGNTDLEGTESFNFVETIGWDYGEVEENSLVEYFFEDQLLGGSQFTATLNWFVGRSWIETLEGGSIVSSDDYFTDLALELWNLDENGNYLDLVAVSDASYINTEHFSIELEETGFYALNVAWLDERYDFVDNDRQSFGLAWHATAVPEPVGGFLLLMSIAFVSTRRRLRI